MIAAGTYRLAFPEGWNGAEPLPAVLFFHGFNASAASVLNSSLPATFGQAGYLLIVPDGAVLPGRDVRGWPGRKGAPGQRDDLAFIRDVMADVAHRVPLDAGRVLVAGFSAGGSMAWLLACYEGQRFAAFVSVAGALRRPQPSADCPGGPVRMLHIHGFTDTQVPLEGRQIRDWHQGDVFEGLARLRQQNGCPSRPSRIELGEPYRCRIWDTCASGREIELCLHDGGHEMPEGWADVALAWFEQGPSRD